MGLEYGFKGSENTIAESTTPNQPPAVSPPPTPYQNPNQEPDHLQNPPPYTSSTSHVNALAPPNPTPNIRGLGGLPNLDYSQYCPPHFKVATSWLQAADGSIITNHELFVRSPEALKRVIKTQAALPPKPIIKIQGTRAGGSVDFDLKLNLMSYFIRPEGEAWNYLEIGSSEEGGSSSSRRKGKAKEAPADELDDLVKRFCKDQVTLRQLVITRETTNHDTENIEGRIRSLISRLNYPGTVTITFPILHSKATIQPPQKPLAVLHNLFRSTRKYEVKAVWPYADVGVDHRLHGEGGSSGGGGGNGVARKFAVQSEDDWWRDWKDAIRVALLAKRRGWVTVEDRLEGLMGMRVDEGVEVGWSDA